MNRRSPAWVMGVLAAALLAGCVAKPGLGGGGSGSAVDGGAGPTQGSDAGGADAVDGSVPTGIPGVNGATLVSDLDVTDAMKVCTEADQDTGLAGHLQRACQAEAYLLSLDQTECIDNLSQCVAAGATSSGLEKPSPCASDNVDLSDCNIHVSELLACAMQSGAFWQSRSCDPSSLAPARPACTTKLAARCPSVYANAPGNNARDAGSSGGGTDAGAGGETNTGHCTGVGNSCSQNYSSGQCFAAGCAWSDTTLTCSGGGSTCASSFSEFSCTAMSGCTWVQ